MTMRYALYYGPGAPGLLDGYDLAILAPAAWPLHMRRHLHAKLLGYVSVLEIPAGGSPPDHVLRLGGRPVDNARWSNWVLDPRHPGTLQRLLSAAETLRADGWDGLFLDTVAPAEWPDLPRSLRSELIPATAHLIAELAAAWPAAMRIQNWGFGPLLPLTAPYLHGLCWEDFPYEALATGADPGSLQMARRLRTWGLHVLALNEQAADPAAARAVAKQWGFSWYGAPGAYTLPPATEPTRGG